LFLKFKGIRTGNTWTRVDVIAHTATSSGISIISSYFTATWTIYPGLVVISLIFSEAIISNYAIKEGHYIQLSGNLRDSYANFGHPRALRIKQK